MKCLWNIDSSLLIAKGIDKCQQKLTAIKIKRGFNFDGKFTVEKKSYLVLMNAFSFCLNLKTLYLSINFERSKEISIPKSLYNFLGFYCKLKELKLDSVVLKDCMNFSCFKNLIALHTLAFHNCVFELKTLKTFFENNFEIPNLFKLVLNKNDFEVNLNNFNTSTKILIPPFNVKIPELLYCSLNIFQFKKFD